MYAYTVQKSPNEYHPFITGCGSYKHRIVGRHCLSNTNINNNNNNNNGNNNNVDDSNNENKNYTLSNTASFVFCICLRVPHHPSYHQSCFIIRQVWIKLFYASSVRQVAPLPINYPLTLDHIHETLNNTNTKHENKNKTITNNNRTATITTTTTNNNNNTNTQELPADYGPLRHGNTSTSDTCHYHYLCY